MKRAIRSRVLADSLDAAGVRAICESCGCSPTTEGVASLILFERRELRRCDSCGREFDEDGEPLGVPYPDGSIRCMKVFVRRTRPVVRRAAGVVAPGRERPA